MKTLIPQREHFRGPERLSPAWELRKDRKSARCEAWSHQFGFELRLFVGQDLMQSQVVRVENDLVELIAGWRDACEAKGWT